MSRDQQVSGAKSLALSAGNTDNHLEMSRVSRFAIGIHDGGRNDNGAFARHSLCGEQVKRQLP